MHADPRVARVWPSPEPGLTYVRQELAGGEYLSTGQFATGVVDAKGRGRTFSNVARVTSLFFDADLLSLYDAARAAKGAVLERKAADRKRRLYAERPALVDGFRRLLLGEFLPVLEGVIGHAPTLVMDSGWGYHAHYAVAEDMQADKVALRNVCAAILSEANRRALELGLTMHPAITVGQCFDATFDVGCRLARAPGTMNTKAPGDPRPVMVVTASPTILTRSMLLRLQEDHTAPGQLALGTPGAVDGNEDAVPRPARPRQARTTEVDFRAMRLQDGRVWQQVISALSPGERTKVVCPFGGTTIGSGFFAVEGDGRARYYSAPTATTYWNTHTAVQTPGLAQLIRGQPRKKGEVGDYLKTVSNLVAMLSHDGSFDLWYDAFAQCEMDGADPLTDAAWVRVVTHMESAYGWTWRVGKELVWSTLETVCRSRSRNPVQDWLATLKWDGVPRMDRWLIESCQAEDTDLYRTYARRWLIGVVARAMDPGCKLDTMLVLSGPQGAGKSTVFREWVNIPGIAQLFSDTRFNLRDKDAYLQLYSAWLYEDAELAGSSTADQETKKAFLSSAIDRIRPPYGRKVRTYKRHTVVVGTTNEKEILRDKTGARRYWVVELPGDCECDPTWVSAWRNQLFAEAAAAYAAGEQWWLTRDESLWQKLHNTNYEWEDWYTQCAKHVSEGNGGGWPNRFTVAQFARSIDDRINPQSRGISLSAALIRSGFRKKRSNGATWYYRPGETTHRDDGLRSLDTINNVRVGGMPPVLTEVS